MSVIDLQPPQNQALHRIRRRLTTDCVLLQTPDDGMSKDQNANGSQRYHTVTFSQYQQLTFQVNPGNASTMNLQCR